MKLSMLTEDNFLQMMRKKIGKTYFAKPGLHTINPRSGGFSGQDSGSRASGFTFMSTGVPRKGRHRRYFAITPPNSQ